MIDAQSPDNAKPNRGGAPLGNANRFRNGLRSALTIGSVPKRLRYIRTLVSRLRRELEASAQEIHGTLGPTQLAAINRATRNELVALYVMRELKDRDEGMSSRDRMSLWDRLTSATEARDKALTQLGLAKPDAVADLWGDWAPAGDGIHEIDTSGKGHRHEDPKGEAQAREVPAAGLADAGDAGAGQVATGIAASETADGRLT